MQSREKFEPRVSSSQVHTLLICAIELVQACYSAWTLASLSLIWRLMYFKRFLWEDLITSYGWKVFFFNYSTFKWRFLHDRFLYYRQQFKLIKWINWNLDSLMFTLDFLPKEIVNIEMIISSAFVKKLNFIRVIPSWLSFINIYLRLPLSL